MARVNPVLVRLIGVLARQLPNKQALREAEWLAELEELTTGMSQVRFVGQCVLAALKMQPQPVWAAVRWGGKIIILSLKWLRKTLRITEHDTIRMQPPELMPDFFLYSQLRSNKYSGAPEDPEPVRFNFSEKE